MCVSAGGVHTCVRMCVLGAGGSGDQTAYIWIEWTERRFDVPLKLWLASVNTSACCLCGSLRTWFFSYCEMGGGGGYWFLSWCGWKSIFVCHEFLVTKFQLIMMDRAPLEEMNGMCICPVWHQYLIYLWKWAWVFTGIFLVIWLSDAVLINWLSSFKEMQPFFENQCVLMCCHPHVCRLSESSGAHV